MQHDDFVQSVRGLGEQKVPRSVFVLLNEAFQDSADFSAERIGQMEGEDVYLCFLKTLTDPQRFIFSFGNAEKGPMDSLLQQYEGYAPFTGGYPECERAICEGQTVLCLPSSAKGIILETVQTQQRSIQSPTTENVIRGPMYAFNESLATNSALIRQRVQSSKLKISSITIGEISRTRVNLFYLESVSEPQLVEKLKEDLRAIRTDGLEDSGQLLRLLVRNKRMLLFPRSLATERPDRAASSLLKGKVVIMVEGSPFALIVPAIFTDFWLSPEDTYLNPYVSYFLTALRFLALFINLFLPAAYVALTSVNVDINRFEISLAAAASREGVPYPVIVETVLMLIVIDFIVEAGVRLPKTISSTVTMVGGVVLGQAVIQANIVSNLLMIIVAMTAITNFIVIDYQMGLVQRVLKYFTLAGAGMAGVLGIMFCFACLVFYLSCLESFGSPYLNPQLPGRKRASHE